MGKKPIGLSIIKAPAPVGSSAAKVFSTTDNVSSSTTKFKMGSWLHDLYLI